jgi:hypothetical protein
MSPACRSIRELGFPVCTILSRWQKPDGSLSRQANALHQTPILRLYSKLHLDPAQASYRNRATKFVSRFCDRCALTAMPKALYDGLDGVDYSKNVIPEKTP